MNILLQKQKDERKELAVCFALRLSWIVDDIDSFLRETANSEAQSLREACMNEWHSWVMQIQKYSFFSKLQPLDYPSYLSRELLEGYTTICPDIQTKITALLMDYESARQSST